MKTLTELFHIQAIATQESIDNRNITPEHTFNTWFFDYSGHVNKMDAKMYPIVWAISGLLVTKLPKRNSAPMSVKASS